MAKPSLSVVALVVVSVVCGCSQGHGTNPSTSTTETVVTYKGPAPASETRHVVVKRVPHSGLVLVDGKGYALYGYLPDRGGSVCVEECAHVWPPFRLTPANVLDTSPALAEELIAVVHDPKGGRMVKYGGWLLHSYTGDTSPGAVNGQGMSSYGGHWYLISPSGALIK